MSGEEKEKVQKTEIGYVRIVPPEEPKEKPNCSREIYITPAPKKNQ